ncbi:MAG: DNA mismatch repair protein MutS, partial [Syntrophomonadaceae bacterium]|nr:DNA mismatch repair protein MutS [Syntrophomonadaceae bacterium]
MNVFLMHRDQDFVLEKLLPPQAADVRQDLALELMLQIMAGGDELVMKSSMQALLSPSLELESLLYRQQILRDCLSNRQSIRTMYALTEEALTGEQKFYFGMLRKYPDAVLRRANDVMNMLLEVLVRLRGLADNEASKFVSPGFKRFFTMLKNELEDDYIAQIRSYLQELRFENGMLISAELGSGNKGSNYTLRRSNRKEGEKNWLQRFFGLDNPEF